jgi:hypothetical protein
VAVTSDVARDGGGTPPRPAPGWCAALPQPVVTVAAASTADATAARRLTAERL